MRRVQLYVTVKKGNNIVIVEVLFSNVSLYQSIYIGCVVFNKRVHKA